MRVATLRFAKASIWVLNLANPRAERDGHAKNEGGNTWICQTKHLRAQFGKCKDGEG